MRQREPIGRNPRRQRPVAAMAQPAPVLAGAVVVVLVQTDLRDVPAKLTRGAVLGNMGGSHRVAAFAALPLRLTRSLQGSTSVAEEPPVAVVGVRERGIP
jgi:hypothetical protein